ncbi:MAG: glycoside hydrolase family 2 TIM barrel-domain containing protein, partial [Eubacteriales bacterium]|nr:glycoside hydrolase family 2 TIM barrel-domain containing protein [Eubacteriales bacterium]
VQGRCTLEELVPGNRAEWLPPMLERVRAMYERDKNHPSILIWSCGNESYGGTVILEMSRLLRQLDDTRPVHYEGVSHDPRYPESTDIASQMYTPATDLEAFLKEHRDKPMILCEYAHAMGNAFGAVHKYIALTKREPLFQGGFIWDYIDQSVTAKNRYGKEYQAYGGDFDDRPNDGDFCCNGIVYGGDRTPSPKMQEVKFLYQPVEITFPNETSVQLYNRALFTDTGVYDAVALLHKNGILIEERPIAANVAPGKAEVLPLPFIKQTAPGEYTVTVSLRYKADTKYAPAGYEAAFGQTVYQVEQPNKQQEAAPIRVVRGLRNIGVIGEGFQILFSLTEGGPVSYRKDGRELIKQAPRPNFWRAPVDDDYGNGMPFRYAQWKIASLYATTVDAETQKPFIPTVEESPGEITLTYTYALPTAPAASCTVSYTVTGNGNVETVLRYAPVEVLKDMPEFGMLFTMDADYAHFNWYGLGPADTYADRCMGGRLGRYETTALDNMALYVKPQECGNKSGVREAAVTDAAGHGLRVTGKDLNVSVLPYTPHELENAKHGYQLPEVHDTVLRVSLAQMGVAGDNAWGARTHPEYLVNVSKPLELRFTFCAL